MNPRFQGLPVRGEQVTQLKASILSYPGVAILGVLVGVLASVINASSFLSQMFFGPMATTYGYYVIFAGLIALNSETALRAGLNCGLFFLVYLAVFYGYEWLTTGVFQTGWLVRWLIVTAFTPVGGWLVWHARKVGWFGIVGAALPLPFLAVESAQILIGLPHDKIIQLNGLWVTVPTNAWYIVNDLLNVAIYLAFAGYILHIFPKSGGRLWWLAAAALAAAGVGYYVLQYV
jgi:hypothetical protein